MSSFGYLAIILCRPTFITCLCLGLANLLTVSTVVEVMLVNVVYGTLRTRELNGKCCNRMPEIAWATNSRQRRLDMAYVCVKRQSI